MAFLHCTLHSLWFLSTLKPCEKFVFLFNIGYNVT